MNLDEFVEYCFWYYGPGGIHNMNYTRKQIKKATCKYLFHLKGEFCGDTLDRERVLLGLEGGTFNFLNNK